MTKNILYVLGAVFILVGLLGFVMNPILGIFAVDTLHNIVHLVSGILAIWFARQGDAQGMMYAKVFGIVYLLVAVLGFTQASSGKILGLLAINGADNLLHVVLAAVLLYVGFMMKPAQSSPTPTPMA
jgi:predicted small integral membrane protein